jgi:uncharacterized protein YdaU (DUF1376 family)
MSTRKNSGRNPMDSMPIHIGDWFSSETVALLGPAGESFYLRLLMHQWKNEADGLPADPEMLRRLSGASPKEWRATWAMLERHFPVCEDGKRRNARTENERRFALDRREKRSAAGKKGNATRWHGDEDGPPEGPDSDGDGIAMRSQNPRKPVAGPSQNHRPSPSPSLTATADAAAVTPDAAAAPAGHAERFADSRHRESYAAIRRSHRFPDQLDAMVAGLAEGLGAPRGRPLTWHQLGQGLLDLRAQQRDVTTFSLGAFAAKVPLEPVKPALELVRDDLPGTIRDTAGAVVWHPGMPADRPSDDDIAANGWSVAA